MYSIAGYGKMLADSVRMNAYGEALRRTITPSSVFLDIGTGTGVFAMMACKLGARRVYALEPSNAITIAREVAAANGMADQIEFIQDVSTRVELPERADVIVSDLRDLLPLFRQHIPSIVDARRRLLAPNGVMIPARDTLWAAILEMPEMYDDYVSPWNDGYGFDMTAARRVVTNTGRKVYAQPEQLLTKPKLWATLDYSAIEQPDVSAQIDWKAQRAGTAHAVCLWFDATLFEDIGFSNAPGNPKVIYGNTFFPLSAPVTLEEGDKVSVNLQANLVGDDYIWSWTTRVSNPKTPSQLKADFKQSTFFGTPMSTDRLRKRGHKYIPTLNEEGEIDKFILAQMEGDLSSGDIARLLADRFPERFRNWHEALTRVGDISQKYGR